MAYNAAELTVVLANLAPAGASWRVLCPYGSVFEGSGVEVGCPAAARGRLEGGVNGTVRGTVAAVATSCVTPEFEGKLECINYMCARIKLYTRNDSVNIRYSAKA
jgi:hypothetical protein